MKTNKTKIVIAAAIAAVSMAAFTGCSGTYTIDENGKSVRVSNVEGTRANAGQVVSDDEIIIEPASESAPAEQASSKAEDGKAAPAQTTAAAQEAAPAATSAAPQAATQNAATAVTPVLDQAACAQNDAPAQTTTAAQPVAQAETTAQTNSDAVDVSAASQAADNAIYALNIVDYAVSGHPVRSSDGLYDENFELCNDLETGRYYHLPYYDDTELKNSLYSGYLSDNFIASTGCSRAANCIVEHNGEYYFDNNYMGSGNYSMYERADSSVNIVDDNTVTINARCKDAWKLSGEGDNCVITMKRTADGQSWQIDSIG